MCMARSAILREVGANCLAPSRLRTTKADAANRSAERIMATKTYARYSSTMSIPNPPAFPHSLRCWQGNFGFVKGGNPHHAKEFYRRGPVLLHPQSLAGHPGKQGGTWKGERNARSF